MASIHISMPAEMIADLDRYVEENKRYDSRSDAIQDAVGELIE